MFCQPFCGGVSDEIVGSMKRLRAVVDEFMLSSQGQESIYRVGESIVYST